MIYESAKDYGTGEILMIHDGETTVQEVCDYLQRNHSQEVNEGDQLHFTDASDNHGMTNPATINFSPANDIGMARRGKARIQSNSFLGVAISDLLARLIRLTQATLPSESEIQHQ